MTIAHHARRLLLEVLVIFAAAELCVMLLLPTVAPMLGSVQAGVLDVGMLLLIASPALYWRFAAAFGGGTVAPQTSQREFAKSISALALAGATQVVCLVLTATGVWWQANNLQARAKAQFELGTDRTEAEIVQRLNRTLFGLKGARGAIAANPDMERKDFQAYVASRELATEFPGIRGFGLIRRVERKNLANYVAAQRAHGAPAYAAHTSGSLSDLYLVESVEPLGANRAALGFDLGQDPRRRAAVEAAVFSGEPTLLAKIELLQDTQRSPGFIYLLPVYKPGTHPQTPTERLRDLQCLVYAPIVVHELLASVVNAADGHIDFELFEGSQPAPDMAIFDADGMLSVADDGSYSAPTEDRQFRADRYMLLGNHEFTLRTSSTERFDAAQDHTSLVLIAVGGLALGLLLTSAVWLLAAGRQRAQAIAQAMTEELRQMAQVVEHTDNAVTVMDRQLRIVWVNAGFSRITGYAREEAVGKTPSELLASDQCNPDAVQALVQAAARGEACRVELVNRAKDGHHYWADTEMQPTFSTDGQLLGFMEIGTDISDQKRLQQALEGALRDANALLGTIHTHAIVSVSDRSGKIIEVNDAFCRISGYTRDELMGQDHRIVNSGTHDTPFWDGFWENIASGKPWRGEICNRAKNGQLYWVDSMIAPFVDSHGLVEKYVSIRTDITERKQHERALEEARQRAEQATASKGQFLANMSHEIRTPMNSIIGMTRMVLDAELPPTQRDYLQKAHTSANSLLRILNDILDFSKINAGQLQLEQLPFDLHATVAKVVDLFELSIRKKSLAWTLDIAPDVPTRLIGDALRLNQVLTNLLSNAIKFTAAGHIALRITATPSDAVTAQLQFTVEDTGIGMDASQRSNLFTPFTQADSSITRQFGGTGLGLSITKQLVEMMGGSIAAHSVPGQGSQFTFGLRFARDTSPPPPADTPASAAAQAPATLAAPALQETPGQPVPPRVHSADWPTLAPQLQELQALLAARSLRARKVAESLALSLAQTASAEPFQAVLESVRQLDFDSALSALINLQNQGLLPAAPAPSP